MYILPGPLPGEAEACQPLHRFPRILGLTGLWGGQVCPLFYSQYLFIYSLHLFLFPQNLRFLFPFLLTLSSPTSYLPFFYKLFTLAVFVHFLIYFFLSFFSILFLFQCFLFSCADIFKLSRSPGIYYKKLILPTYVVWQCWYNNSIPTRGSKPPIDCSKITAQFSKYQLSLPLHFYMWTSLLFCLFLNKTALLKYLLFPHSPSTVIFVMKMLDIFLL